MSLKFSDCSCETTSSVMPGFKIDGDPSLGFISFSISAVRSHTIASARKLRFMAFIRFRPSRPTSSSPTGRNLLAFIRREHVVYLNADFYLHTKPPEELFFVPNVETLRPSNLELSTVFLQPNPNSPLANTKLLPSLRSLHLEGVILGDDGWGNLSTYVARQSPDNQVILLEVIGSSPYMHPDVVNETKGLVEEFTCHQPPEEGGRPPCSCVCSADEEDE